MNILELELNTNHPLQALADFYTKLLAKPPLEQTDQRLELQVGATQLTFEYRASTSPIRYHFAINIPENQFEAALRWTRERVNLIGDKTGKEVFHFKDWNADALYFYDPADNILEFISRHTLNNESKEVFGVQSLLNISEIGIVAHDVAEQVRNIQKQLDIQPYKASVNAEFTPVGDEHGLFIVVKEGRAWFPDTGILAERSPVTTVVEQAGHTAKLTFS